MLKKFYLKPPHRIDASFADLFRCLIPTLGSDMSGSEIKIADQEGHSGEVFFSVRSAWDAFLTVQSYPKGSEVILSGINIPHMAEIVRLHGLNPVFADINEGSLLPTLQDIKSKKTNRTVAVLCAHLFGSWSSLDEIATWCHAEGLLLIEDCAQCFMGRDFAGTDAADLTFFSFGTIKRSTALGGAVVFIRQGSVREKMLTLQSGYQEASGWAYKKKCIKVSVLKVLCWPFVYAQLISLVTLCGRNPEHLLRESVRGFPASSLPASLRFKPHSRLRSMVRKSWLKTSQQDWIQRAEAIQLEFAQGLYSGVSIAGEEALLRTHWLLPIVTDKPEELLLECRNSGLDATRGVTSLIALAGLHTPASHSMLSRIVYMPIRIT